MHAPKGPSRPCDRTVSKIYHIIPVFHYLGRRSQTSEFFIGEEEPEERKKRKKMVFLLLFFLCLKNVKMIFLTNPPSTPWHQKKKKNIVLIHIFPAFSLFFLSSFKAWTWPFFAGCMNIIWYGGFRYYNHDNYPWSTYPTSRSSYFYMLQIKAKSISIWYIVSFFRFLFNGVSRRALH